MVYDEQRYVMSQFHPRYSHPEERDWCIIEGVLRHPDGSTSMVEVHWYDKRGDAIGYEAIPLDWLALKAVKQTSRAYVSLW